MDIAKELLKVASVLKQAEEEMVRNPNPDGKEQYVEKSTAEKWLKEKGKFKKEDSNRPLVQIECPREDCISNKARVMKETSKTVTFRCVEKGHTFTKEKKKPGDSYVEKEEKSKQKKDEKKDKDEDKSKKSSFVENLRRLADLLDG